MAVYRQWALPISVDVQDPQLLSVTGHAGGARGVPMQTLRGGVLCAAVSKVIAVFCRDRGQGNGFDTLFAQKETVCICTREINYLNVCM